MDARLDMAPWNGMGAASWTSIGSLGARWKLVPVLVSTVDATRTTRMWGQVEYINAYYVLLYLLQKDQQLAKLLYSDPRPSLQTFAAGLIRECLAADPPLATQAQFSFSLEVLNQLAQAGKTNEE